MQFCAVTANPVPLVLDLFQLKRTPYAVATRSGFRLLIRPRSGDRFAFYENLIRRDYLKNGATLPKNGTVVDIGANIGCFSILAARLIGSQGRVLAIEPELACFQQLVKNAELNNLANIIPVNVAVGAFEGTVSLCVSRNSLFSSIHPEVDAHQVVGRSRTVDCRTIETLLDTHGIDRVNLLKVDCEGAEYEIFDAMTHELASRIDQICMEAHYIEGRTPADLRQRLQVLGFEWKHTSPLYARRLQAPGTSR